MARLVLFRRGVSIPAEDAVLLAEALGVPRRKRLAFSERFRRAGGLDGLSRGGPAVLAEVLDPAGVARLEAVLELSGRLLGPVPRPARIDGPEAVLAYLGPRVAILPVETFWVLLLDVRGRPLGAEQVAQGTLTACLVHPREVFAPAIRARAASIVVAHNHPSGDPEPSEEDRVLTQRLAEASDLLGIPLLDHVVVARDGHRSLGGAPARSYRTELLRAGEGLSAGVGGGG